MKKFGTEEIGKWNDDEEGRAYAELWRKTYGGTIRKKGNRLYLFKRVSMEQVGDWEWEKGKWKIKVHFLSGVPNITILPPSHKNWHMELSFYEVKQVADVNADLKYLPVLGSVPGHLYQDLKTIALLALTRR